MRVLSFSVAAGCKTPLVLRVKKGRPHGRPFYNLAALGKRHDIAAGSTNVGVIGPQAFYANTAIRLTANGANFTGGAVRIAIHYLTFGLPS